MSAGAAKRKAEIELIKREQAMDEQGDNGAMRKAVEQNARLLGGRGAMDEQKQDTPAIAASNRLRAIEAELDAIDQRHADLTRERADLLAQIPMSLLKGATS